MATLVRRMAMQCNAIAIYKKCICQMMGETTCLLAPRLAQHLTIAGSQCAFHTDPNSTTPHFLAIECKNRTNKQYKHKERQVGVSLGWATRLLARCLALHPTIIGWQYTINADANHATPLSLFVNV